jgi:arylsulfatase A-like enzyme
MIMRIGYWMGLILCSQAILVSAVTQQPNIVLILADDMGYADPGFNGGQEIPTPHLDTLASSGVRFEQGYVSASVCAPSRCGLMTGRYQQQFGAGENPPEQGWPDNPRCPDAGLPVSEQTLAELLKPSGYTTGIIGKWHMGIREGMRPNDRGFDYFYGFLNGAHSYIESSMEYTSNFPTWPTFRNREIIKHNGYYTDMFSDEGVQFIKRNKEKPFFLYMAYNAVHDPWQAPERVMPRVAHIKDEKRRTFAGMLVAMDDGIGRLVQVLKDAGVYQNTLIVFLSDNGDPMDSVSSSGHLRGCKGDTYEGGIRVPFVMSWPGKLATGTTYEKPISGLDIAPTIVALAGAEAPVKAFDGVNLMPYLAGANAGRPHDVLYWRRDSDYAIRKGDWKLTWNDGVPTGVKQLELFNLAEDPGEQKNLAKELPEMTERLQGMFEAWDGQLPDNEWWGGPFNRKRKELASMDKEEL